MIATSPIPTYSNTTPYVQGNATIPEHATSSVLTPRANEHPPSVEGMIDWLKDEKKWDGKGLYFSTLVSGALLIYKAVFSIPLQPQMNLTRENLPRTTFPVEARGASFKSSLRTTRKKTCWIFGQERNGPINTRMNQIHWFSTACVEFLVK